jgi:DNA-3-methyladenine glycosylase I
MDGIDNRCPWCLGSELYKDYHDHEWGRPVREEQKMFEFLILETFQAGLSWITILNKRENFRKAFHNFDIEKVASMNALDVSELLNNKGIIRNRQKIEAAINNAKVVKELHLKGKSLVDILWGYVDGTPIDNQRREMTEVPAVTELATKISKDLKKIGFKFIGPTTMYAHMQASGMVNDHLITCPSYSACLK